MKKTIIAFLLILLAVSLFGCTPDKEPSDGPGNDPAPPVAEKKVVKTFYNTISDVDEQFTPTLTLYDDNTATYLENFYEGMTMIYGTYETEDSEGMLRVYVNKMTVGDREIEIQYPNLEFYILKDDVLMLVTNMSMSRYYDILLADRSVRRFETYQGEIDGAPEEWWNTIVLYTDRSFELQENYYEGLEKVDGVYECYVEDGLNFLLNVIHTQSGIGDAYHQIHLVAGDEGLQLLTDLHSAKKGYTFDRSHRDIMD